MSKKVKTKTGALSKSAGFPGGEMVIQDHFGIWYDENFKDVKPLELPKMKSAENKHIYWQ